jgi:hypothetical protein
MPPYRMPFIKGKAVIDVTEDSPDEEAYTTAPAEPNPNQTYPTPSRSPEASSSQVQTRAQTDQRDDRPIKPLPRSQSNEVSCRAISSTIKTKVAIALMIEGKQNLNREKLCLEVSLPSILHFIANLVDWSF